MTIQVLIAGVDEVGRGPLAGPGASPVQNMLSGPDSTWCSCNRWQIPVLPAELILPGNFPDEAPASHHENPDKR